MRTTLTLDDSLYTQALALSDPGIGRSELIEACVKAYIQRQSALRLAALGGQIPEMEPAPRRQQDEAAGA
jgi:metal-responsive CopG/Arc/MetJ family transcriptional regulator